MGVLGTVLGDASEKSGGVISKAFSGVAGVYKDAMAANKADDIHEADVIATDAKSGKLHNTGVIHDIGDGIEDGLNIVTMGVSRRVTNAFTKEIDYKALKTAKKEAKAAGEDMTVKDRTAALSDIVGSGVDQIDETEIDTELE